MILFMFGNMGLILELVNFQFLQEVCYVVLACVSTFYCFLECC